MALDVPRRATENRPTTTECLVEKREFDAIFQAWLDRVRVAILSAQREAMDARGAGRPAGKLDDDATAWALVGIKRRGAVLARRLWNELKSSISPLLYGEVDISLYRDDYHIQASTPKVLGTEIAFRVDGVNILLVDDVLYTGRTVRAAIDQILDFGRPRVIQLAVFVDRGHRELPIAANFVGKDIPTGREDVVRVRLKELSEVDGVEVIRLAQEGGS